MTPVAGTIQKSVISGCLTILTKLRLDYSNGRKRLRSNKSSQFFPPTLSLWINSDDTLEKDELLAVIAHGEIIETYPAR
jgi:hypothetical protein